MTITPHFLAGAAVATTTNNLPLAFLLGFFSHFLLDALPHVDPGTFLGRDEKKSWPAWLYALVFIEFIIVITLFFWLFGNRPDFITLGVGGLGGITMDIIDSQPLRFLCRLPLLKQIHWLHHKTHYYLPRDKWYLGLPSQIIVIGGFVWYLLKF